MIQINKVGNAIVIEFTDNDKYLFNGTIEVAPNELMVVVDLSNMVTFKKMSNGDTLFGQSYEKIRINDEPVTKENIVEKFATIGFTSGGGGGTGGAVDSVNGLTGTVIITASSIGAITKETADATYQPIGDYAVKSDLSTLATKSELNTKLDTSVYEVDKANFATKEELNSKADASAIADMATKTWVGEQGYLTEIPSEYVTDSELTEALADKADKTGAEFTGTIAAPIVAFMRESQGMMGAIQADSNNILFRTYNAGVKSITFQVLNTAALKLTEAGIWENNQLLENKYAQLSDLNDFATTEQLNTKQDTLVSGTNIKTINGQTLLGEGNIEIQGGGTITVDSALSTDSENPVLNKVITNAINGKLDAGDYALKSDLDNLATKEELATKADASALSAKLDTLVSGTNIKTINGESILGSGDLTILSGTQPRTWTFTTSSSLTTGDSATITPSGFRASEWLSQVTIGDMVYIDKGPEFMKLSVSNVYHRTTGNSAVGLSFYSTLLYDIIVVGSNFTLNINRVPKGKTENGTSIGQEADVTATGSYGVAIGYGVKSNGYNAIAIGNYVQEDELLSINIGDRLKVSNTNGLSYWDGTDMRNLKEQLDSKQNVLTIDTEMSDTSLNAVQNKVIKAYIDSLVGNILTQLQEINGTN